MMNSPLFPGRLLPGALLVALGTLTLPTHTRAETRRALPLEECIRIALEHNLDIQIQRVNPRIARLTLSGSYGAYDPTLNVAASYGSTTTPGGVDQQNRPYPNSVSDNKSFSAGLNGALPTGLNYQLSTSSSEKQGTSYGSPFLNDYGFAGITLAQPLLKNLWIDSARLNISLNRHNLRQSESALRYQIMNTVTEVARAYYELIAAAETVEVQRAAVDLAEQLWQENQRRVEIGVLAPLDEKQAQSQAEASRADLLTAESTLKTQQNTVKGLLSDRFMEWQDVTVEPTDKLGNVPEVFNRQDSWSKGMTERPDLEQAKLDLEKQHITLTYDQNQLYPQLDLQGSYGRTGNQAGFGGAWNAIADGSGPSYSVGLVFSMPLSRRQARMNYRVAKEGVEQALLQLKKLEQNILIDIDNAITQAQTAFEQIAATKAAREYAEQALAAEQDKLAAGKSTSFQVLQLQRDLTQRRANYIRALADYNSALAGLALSEGSTLEHYGIRLDVH